MENPEWVENDSEFETNEQNEKHSLHEDCYEGED